MGELCLDPARNVPEEQCQTHAKLARGQFVATFVLSEAGETERETKLQQVIIALLAARRAKAVIYHHYANSPFFFA